jgi:hypothetical protein
MLKSASASNQEATSSTPSNLKDRHRRTPRTRCAILPPMTLFDPRSYGPQPGDRIITVRRRQPSELRRIVRWIGQHHELFGKLGDDD